MNAHRLERSGTRPPGRSVEKKVREGSSKKHCSAKQLGLRARRVAGAAVGAALLVACWGGSKPWGQHVPALCTKLRRHRAARKKQAFVLMVSLVFEEPCHRDDFLTLWQPLADHVRAQESGTLAFELLQLDTEPKELLVFERYIDKTYYLQVHRTSPAMAAFKQRLAAAGWQVKISGRSYNELNIGFM